MEKSFPIVGSFNNERYPNINCERTVNLFEYVHSNVDPKNPPESNALVPTSGLVNSGIFFSTDTVGFREQFTFFSNGNTNVYSVVGSGVYLSNDSLSATLLGRLNTTAGYVSIDANTFQIIFVDGVNGWIYDTMANTFEKITDTSFPTRPIDVCYLDGFFVVANGQTNTFQLSSFNQGMVWGGSSDIFVGDSTTDLLTMTSTANYATGTSFTVSTTGTLPTPLLAATTYYSIRTSATTLKVATSYENAIMGVAIDLLTNGTPTNTIMSDGQLQLGSITAHPGTIVGCSTLHRRLFLFSQNFTEVWENAGTGTALPFRRNNSLLLEVGTPSIASVITGFDMMFFLSQDKDGLGPVVRLDGTQPMAVSSPALDHVLADYNRQNGVDDARGILVKEDGIIFYRLNFTRANHTWVFNQTMSNPSRQLWHEEEVLNGDRHPAQTHVYYNGYNYYGSYKAPILYRVDSTLNSNNGEAIRRMRIQSVPAECFVRRRIDKFYLLLRQGAPQILGGIQNDFPIITENEELILTEDGNFLVMDMAYFVALSDLLRLETKEYPVPLLDENGLRILTESGLVLYSENDIEVVRGTVIHPSVFLSLSKNGGQSFGTRIRAPMGNEGEYTWRTNWRKLGVVPKGQNLVIRLEFFNKIPFVILGASWDYEVLPE